MSIISYFYCEDCSNCWGISGVVQKSDKCYDCGKSCKRVSKSEFLEWQISVGHRTPLCKKSLKRQVKRFEKYL